MKKNWYAVYTKSNWEGKLASLLAKKKIENYCPFNRIIYYQGNKKRIVTEPLFPSFVFVYATHQDITIIRQIGLVVNFVYWLGKPVVINDEEIENIKHFIDHYFNIKLEKINVNASGIVRIISVPNIGVNNNMISVTNSNFQLLLPSLGYKLMAEIEKSMINVFNYGVERNKMVS